MLNNSLIEDQEKIHATVQSNIITQALGVRNAVEPDYGFCNIEKEDVFFSTTDGVHDAMDHAELEEVARDALDSLDVSKIINKANENSGRDNSTVIMMLADAKKGWFKWFS